MSDIEMIEDWSRGQLIQEIERLRADNERLRAALKNALPHIKPDLEGTATIFEIGRALKQKP